MRLFLLALRLLCPLAGFDQGTLGVSQHEGDELIIMVDHLNKAAVIALVNVDYIANIKASG